LQSFKTFRAIRSDIFSTEDINSLFGISSFPFDGWRLLPNSNVEKQKAGYFSFFIQLEKNVAMVGRHVVSKLTVPDGTHREAFGRVSKSFAVFCRFEVSDRLFLPFLGDYEERRKVRQNRYFERKKSHLERI